MTHQRRSDVLRALCAQVSEEDGLNPKLDPRGSPRTEFGPRERRFCSQIAVAIQDALQAHAGDPILHKLRVESVEPHPGMTRLLARITLPPAPPTPAFTAEMELARARLSAAAGFVRSMVAQAISRKRVPWIVLELTPALPEPEEAEHD